MGKTNQTGKPHNYPTNRKSYKTICAVTGSRKKDQNQNISKKHALTYFDTLKQALVESKGISLTVWCNLKY